MQDRESVVEILKEYQQALRKEQGRSESLADYVQYLEGSCQQLKDECRHWESSVAGLLSKLKSSEVFVELEKESLYWKNKFSKLAWLANQAVRDVPKRLRKAEAEMLPYNTPEQVYEFVKFCKTFTEELMEKAKGAAAASKEKGLEELKAICF